MAVEFAFIFPIVFSMLYGTFVYGYLFLIQNSLENTSEIIGEKIINLNPLDDQYSSSINSKISDTITKSFKFNQNRITKEVTINNNEVTVELGYLTTDFPVIKMGNLTIPPKPEILKSKIVLDVSL